MASKVKLAQELAQMVKEENISGKERIPNTESHMKLWCSHFAMEEKALRKILEDLRDAHYIFIINIVVADSNTYLSGTDSYVYADYSILNDLKRFAEQKLEKTYESTFYKKKSPFQITRELFPKVKEFNNTPMGKALNESVMIEEFIRVMSNTAFEYTDQWKVAKLRDIYSEAEESVPVMEAELEQNQNVRATDKLKALNVEINPNSPWGKMVSRFPIELLLRIHFRKYEFEIVKKLIQTGKIWSETDLRYVRDTLQDMESRMNRDPILQRHAPEMIELRRLSQAKLNILRKNAK